MLVLKVIASLHEYRSADLLPYHTRQDISPSKLAFGLVSGTELGTVWLITQESNNSLQSLWQYQRRTSPFVVRRGLESRSRFEASTATDPVSCSGRMAHPSCSGLLPPTLLPWSISASTLFRLFPSLIAATWLSWDIGTTEQNNPPPT